ncbi:MAG: ABC transporter ATP-binding protein [Rhizobiaceae bacterium]
MPLLEISDLSASYGAGPVLEGVSLSVEAGAVIGIVGPNGHGKTSLLRAISGLMPQVRGNVSYDGRSLLGVSASKIASEGIVHVPQGDLVYRNMTVFENLQVGGYTNRNAAENARQLDQVYRLFPKLKERSGQLASSLSGGERRMLGIGRGLMMAGARLLMLDEPSLGLAPVVIDNIYTAIDELRQTGLTIVIVEENVMRVSLVANRLSLLNHGSMIWTGTPDDLKNSRELLTTYLGI